MLLLVLFFFFPIALKCCNHDSLDFVVEKLPPSDIQYDKRLSTNAIGEFQESTRENIRIYPLYFLDGVPEKAKVVIQEYLIPAAINYFQATLKVDKTIGNIKIPSDLTCGEVETPAFIKQEGLDTDLILVITADPASTDDYLATAKACNLLAVDERPGVGLINFNYNKLIVDSAVSLERHILTTLHEITHILGFSWNLYQYFRDPLTGERVAKSPVQTKVINGMNVSLLSVEPLVTKLQDYFGCSTIEGAYLENQGESKSGLSHFERRIFYNELMTASDIDDVKISEFTLAVLEGSGWYTVDYSKTEPIFWGKNKGCSFLESSCIDSTIKTSPFAEFCSPLTQRGCTFTGRSQGFCGVESTVTLPSITKSDSLSQLFEGRSPVVDTYADNCPYFVGYTNRDCRNPVNQKDRRDDSEIYGDNSRCFTGNLWVPKEAGESIPYCFESECELRTDGKYRLKVKIGERRITCSKEERFSLTGYVGYFDCPDPNTFCTTQGLGFCPRGCMGKGSCVNQKCVCDAGWEGLDCSFKPGMLNKILTMDNKSDQRTLIYIIVGCCLGAFAILVIGCLVFKNYRKKRDESDSRSTSYRRRKNSSVQIFPTTSIPSKSLMTIPEEGTNSKVSSLTFD